MSECTHDCSTCGGGCHFEVEEGQKPRDILNELREFVIASESEEMSGFFENLAGDLEKELQKA
ncbi:MAG TPA: hypothetical protein IAB17_01915 [Candidatus Alectryocaccobium stercorigallinarum]|jgi:hypothetical protein|nr:hypothetical protein [Candidatus Alectryocaccobium stercorigallinarum]